MVLLFLIYCFKEAELDPKAQLLVDRGITPSVARTLVERFPDRIVPKVEAFDRLDKSATRSPAGFLRRSIEGDWAETKVKKAPMSSQPRKASLPAMTDEDRARRSSANASRRSTPRHARA